MSYLIASADIARFSASFTTVYGGSEFKSYINGNDSEGLVAAASANAATLSLSINSWGTASNIKAALYDEDALVETVVIPASVGTGVVDVALSGNVAITSGNLYRLALYSENGDEITLDSDTSGLTLREEQGGTGSYTSPIDPYPAGSYDSFNEFYWAIQDAAAVADPEQATTGNIPLTPAAGWTSVDLVDPVTTTGSLLHGYTGTAPVTGDQIEWRVTSTLDTGVTVSVQADGFPVVYQASDGDWAADIVIERRVIQTDGTIGITATMTIQVDEAGPVINPILTDTLLDAENSNAAVANETNLAIHVYDTDGGTELYSTATATTNGSGVFTIDDDSVGSVNDTPFVVIKRSNGQTACGTMTVVDGNV